MPREACPQKADGSCGFWQYAITKSISQSDLIELSGRMLSLIPNGIKAFAETAARKLRNGHFIGVAYQTIESINDRIGDTYDVVADPYEEDDAHAFLAHRAFNAGRREEVSTSNEVLRLHQAFFFVADGSEALRDLEARAGVAV
jgi:hypothetical protein